MISRNVTLRIGGLAAVSCLLLGCSKRDPLAAPSQPASPPAVAVTNQPVTPTPATLEDANAVVKRVFRDAALVAPDRNPNFLTGDFNGDESQDIAVIIKPVADKLSEMNQEFPPWILKDPLVLPRPGLPPLRVTANEVLLAVVHGYGGEGWRDPQATQTYLLKNAVGSDVKTYVKRDFLTANQGKLMPRLYGDLIAQVLRGKSGYLYFGGASYSWYDPKHFTGTAEARVVHRGRAPKKDVDLLNLRIKGVATEK